MHTDPLDNAFARANPMFSIVSFAQANAVFPQRRLISSAVEMFSVGQKAVQVKNYRGDHGSRIIRDILMEFCDVFTCRVGPVRRWKIGCIKKGPELTRVGPL